jgi:hypothetical protein
MGISTLTEDVVEGKGKKKLNNNRKIKQENYDINL